MPATTQVQVAHGATPTFTTWTDGGLFHWADTDPTTIGSATPIPVPAAGSNYSWAKQFKLNTSVAPTGSISNLRWFSDGTAVGTGITMWVSRNTTNAQATSTDQTTKRNTAVAGNTTFAAVNATTLTSASPMTVNAGTVLTATTGFGTQDFVVMQAEVGTTAGAGATALRTYSYRYDET